MKIRAKVFEMFEVTVIDFIQAGDRDVKAVYIDHDGKVDSCYINHIKILDKDYVPTTNQNG